MYHDGYTFALCVRMVAVYGGFLRPQKLPSLRMREPQESRVFRDRNDIERAIVFRIVHGGFEKSKDF